MTTGVVRFGLNPTDDERTSICFGSSEAVKKYAEFLCPGDVIFLPRSVVNANNVWLIMSVMPRNCILTLTVSHYLFVTSDLY